MSYRLTKIYTRKGDAGFTTLGGSSISKDDLLVEAVGTIDELNSVIGLVLALQQNVELQVILIKIQNELFDLGGELHFPEKIVITPEKIAKMEEMLDSLNESLPPLKEFILPGGNTAAATCHMARTVCRRAERCLVRLHRQVTLNNPEMLRYVNRLSDLLFIIARILARETNPEEPMWQHQKITKDQHP